MAFSYIPSDGGPRSLPWPLNSFAEAVDELSISGPIGTQVPPDFLDKALRVVAIEIQSGHAKKMTDKGFSPDDNKAGDFEPGGKPFAGQWSYRFNPDNLETTAHPVSHTGGRKIELLVAVSNDYERPIEAALDGLVTSAGGAQGLGFHVSPRTFEPGINLVHIASGTRLPKTIEALKFIVRWQFTGQRLFTNLDSGRRSIYAPVATTENELFLTRGEPQVEGEAFTYERLAHAVRKLGEFDTTDPHELVEKVVRSVSFDGRVTRGAWFLAIHPNLAADCITIAKYVSALTQTVGIPGKAEPVIVFAQPKPHVARIELVPGEQMRLIADLKPEDVEAVERPSPDDPERAGLLNPMFVHPRELWRLSLIDRGVNGGHFNNFEGCVKFTPRFGKTRWYPAGGPLSGQDTFADVLPEAFRSLSWIDNDDKQREKVMSFHKVRPSE